MRELKQSDIQTAFLAMAEMPWQEAPEYYSRYRSRYEAVLRAYAALAPSGAASLLEVGGGQLAFMASRLWNDEVTVADLVETCFASLQDTGVSTIKWNLARDESPTSEKYMFILCSEVLEHLPVPGHVPLGRLRERLAPGGALVLTTPNLYRLRNIAFLAAGRPVFDSFDLPGDAGFGHVLEYSRDHLEWQLQRAGFVHYTIDLVEFAHRPEKLGDRIISAVAAPLRRVPRLRDNLMVIAKI